MVTFFVTLDCIFYYIYDTDLKVLLSRAERLPDGPVGVKVGERTDDF